MKVKGFTASWRKELDSDIWRMPPIYHRVWYWLRQQAAWSFESIPTKYAFNIALRPGQLFVSLEQITDQIWWYENNRKVIPARKTILDVLKWLEKENMIIRISDKHKGTFIHIVNFENYQQVNTTAKNRKDVNMAAESVIFVKKKARASNKARNKMGTKINPLNISVYEPSISGARNKARNTVETYFNNINNNNIKNIYYEAFVSDRLKAIPGFMEAWREWIEFRKKELRKKVTERAAKMQLKFLDKQPNPIAVIEQSIKNSYQGLFELKGNGNGKNKRNLKTTDELVDEAAERYRRVFGEDRR